MSGGLLSNREARPKSLDVAEDKSKISYKTMAFKVEEDLHTALKIHAVRKNKQIGTIINELIKAYLQEQEG